MRILVNVDEAEAGRGRWGSGRVLGGSGLPGALDGVLEGLVKVLGVWLRFWAGFKGFWRVW